MAQRKKSSSTKESLRSRFGTEGYIVGGSIALVVVILAVVIVANLVNGNNISGDIDGVQYFPALTASHVTSPVNYPQTPPVGGPHFPVWQNCGVYTEPLENEYAVHSLEHGAVWITYQPDLPLDQVQHLQDITNQSAYRLLSPYPGIDSPVIVSAWAYQLRLPDAYDGRLMRFIVKYEQGPTAPEPGAACSGGNGQTASQLGLR